ncbi:MAG: type IV secretion system protein VirB10 [Gammaproteobacteria bacterium]|nr:type IV secretion system protein VirB10 [Gammaproteobacteria bacterium]MBL4729708.1 type IV secretion system protein VirB10 [Gammaproteobacteria bacterium]
MSDDNKITEELEDERGIPSVSEEKTQSSNTILGFGMLSLALVFGIWAFWPSEGNTDVDPLPAQTDDAFDRQNISDIQFPDFSEIPTNDQVPLIVDLAIGNGIESSNDFLADPQELARLQAEQDLFERRQRSPLIIYDALPSTTGADRLSSLSEAQRRQADLVERLTSIDFSAGSSDLDTLEARVQSTTGDTAEITATILRDKEFLMTQGKLISAVLETAIASDLPGMTRAIVSENVYSEDGSRLLLDRGSRLIGSYRSGVVSGQARIFVVWDRVITPSSIDIKLNSPGSDSLGRAGLGGEVDSHFMERFGSSMLLSIIGAAAAQSNDEQFNIALGQNFNSSAEIALQEATGIRPTLYKSQGDRISVFVARDINFKPVLDAQR